MYTISDSLTGCEHWAAPACDKVDINTVSQISLETAFVATLMELQSQTVCNGLL